MNVLAALLPALTSAPRARRRLRRRLCPPPPPPPPLFCCFVFVVRTPSFMSILVLTDISTETYSGCVGGGGGVSKSKEKPKDTQLKKISQMSVASKLNLSSLYLKMDKAVQACKLYVAAAHLSLRADAPTNHRSNCSPRTLLTSWAAAMRCWSRRWRLRP
jgi:hypothetical protein